MRTPLQRTEMRRSVSEQAALIGVASGDGRLLALEGAGLTQVVEMQCFLGVRDLAAGQALGVEAGQPDGRPSSARRRGRGTGSAAAGSSGIGSGKGVALMGVGGSYVAGGDAELAKIAGS